MKFSNVLSVALLFFPISLSSQNTFLQTYSIGGTHTEFNWIHLANDTLTILGTTYDTTHNQWGVLYARFDTLGNIIDQRIHLNENGEHFVLNSPSDFIKTQDGGYAICGNLYPSRNTPFIMKLNHAGELVDYWEFPHSSELNSSTDYGYLLEYKNGFIVVGRILRLDNFKTDVYLRRIDKNNHIKWQVNFGDNGLFNYISQNFLINENKILFIKGTKNKTINFEPISDKWKKTDIYWIDSLGQIIDVIEGEEELLFDYPSGYKNLHLQENGDLIYSNITNNYVDDPWSTYQVNVNKGAIGRVDSNFNDVWRQEFGDYTALRNIVYDLAACPDGGWVTSGEYFVPGVGHSGMLGKVTAYGDSLWMRTFLSFPPQLYDDENILSGVVSLPSGSIITAGHTTQTNDEGTEVLGWMVKIDKDGCLEPDCEVATDLVDMRHFNSFKMYPNPFSSGFQIECTGVFDVELVDIMGRQLFYSQGHHGGTNVSTTDIESGSYILRIHHKDGWLMNKVVVKM